MKKFLFLLVPSLALTFNSCYTYKYKWDENETVYVDERLDKTIYKTKDSSGKTLAVNVDYGNLVVGDTSVKACDNYRRNYVKSNGK